MVIDQEDSWATKMWIWVILRLQCGGPGGFKGDNVVDHEDYFHASTNRMDKGPHKCGPKWWRSLQAQTREGKANPDRKGEDSCKYRPEKERLKQA